MTPNSRKSVHRLRSSILKTMSFIFRGYSSAPHGQSIPWTSTIVKSSERRALQPQPQLKALSQCPVPGKTKCWMLWTMMIRLYPGWLRKFLLHPPPPGLQKYDSPSRHLDPPNPTPRSSLPPLISTLPPGSLCSPSDCPVH